MQSPSYRKLLETKLHEMIKELDETRGEDLRYEKAVNNVIQKYTEKIAALFNE